MVKHRDYGHKYYAHLSAVRETLSSAINKNPITKNDIVCLNQHLDHEYILNGKLYENPLLFTANPDSFDENFLYECFVHRLDKCKDSLIMAIKTQKVSEGFIKKILDILMQNKNEEYYYNILHIASGYVKLSEDFIKEWIVDDDNVSESTLLNVIQIQTLSEEFIEENLVDFLGMYRSWDDGTIDCYGWKFLLCNPNAHISQKFFEENGLMNLNLAEYIMYNGYGEIGEEYNYIDLSHFDFDYLYEIFCKAVKDMGEFLEKYDLEDDDMDNYPIFVSFGLDFARKLFAKVNSGEFSVKELFPYSRHPMDNFLAAYFESFLLEEEDIKEFDLHFDEIHKAIYNKINLMVSEEHSQFCWWVMTKTQKLTVSLLEKILCYAKECSVDPDEEPYFDMDDFAMNPYMTISHIIAIDRKGLLDLTMWLDEYEFTLDEVASLISAYYYSATKFKSEKDMIGYCNFVFKSDAFRYYDKIRIFRDVLVYNGPLTSQNYKYFVDYIKDIINSFDIRDLGHYFNNIDPDYIRRLVGYLIAFSEINSEEIETILYEFNIK